MTQSHLAAGLCPAEFGARLRQSLSFILILKLPTPTWIHRGLDQTLLAISSLEILYSHKHLKCHSNVDYPIQPNSWYNDYSSQQTGVLLMTSRRAAVFIYDLTWFNYLSGHRRGSTLSKCQPGPPQPGRREEGGPWIVSCFVAISVMTNDMRIIKN